MTKIQRRDRRQAVQESAQWALCTAQVTYRRDSSGYGKFVPIMRRSGCSNTGEEISEQDTIGPEFQNKHDAITHGVKVLNNWIEQLSKQPGISEIRRHTPQTVCYRWDRPV